MADLIQKYSCTYCQDEIPDVRVHCAICEDIVLCLQCFSAGAEIGPHTYDHDYQLREPSANVFRGKGAWSNIEELRLLDAVEHYGFGSWEDVSKHIETRSPEAAKEEYTNKYLKGVIGKLTWGKAVSTSVIISDDKKAQSSSFIQNLKPLDITVDEATQLEYLPKRDDFQSQYDPEAEQMIFIASLSTDCGALEKAVKLSLADWYVRRLRERARRERMVRDYQLVAQYFRSEHKRSKASKDHRDLAEQFRPFCQFYTSHEYDQFIDGLAKERQLRFRLFELVRYRHNGLTTMDECRHYEQHVSDLLKKAGHVDAAGSIGNTSGAKGLLIPRKRENARELNFVDQKRIKLDGFTSSSPSSES